MNTEIITALVAAIVAVISALISIMGQYRIAKFSDQLAKQRESESKETRIAEIMVQYNDPLLSAALDLQRRLYSIINEDFFQGADQITSFENSYAARSTLYLIAEYLGWVEILRREVQFLGWGDEDRNRDLRQNLEKVTQAFYKGGNSVLLHLPRIEQRAIGEILLQNREESAKRVYECIGYAQFVKNMNNSEFAFWFGRLQKDIELIAMKKSSSIERLDWLQKAIMELIMFLDPTGIRWPKEQWENILTNANR